MSMRPIPPAILKTAMARLRAGESFEVVRQSVSIDADRLRHQLRRAFVDYTEVMQGHKRHGGARGDMEGRPAPLPQRTPEIPIAKSRPRQPKVWHLTKIAPRVAREHAVHDQIMADPERPQPHIRRLNDLSDEERTELKAKLVRWVATGAGRPTMGAKSWIETAS